MFLATRRLWGCHSFVDGRRVTPALQCVALSCRLYGKTYRLSSTCSSRRKRFLPLGRSSPSKAAVTRKAPLVRTRASSGGAGNSMGPSSDEDYSSGGTRLADAFRSWNWLGSTRKMSGESRWRREDDEGDWKYSPEWWGTQGGGWGRNEGDIVFERPTSMANGVVSVTAHPASFPRIDSGLSADHSYVLSHYEWRVLRFNGVTRQSVAKVKVLRHAEDAEKVVFLQQPNCIAFEYVKSLISCGLTALSLGGLDLKPVVSGLRQIRILCIGLGGGTLPLFLAHNLQGATVDAVEIDPVVISAAVNHMGFPSCPLFSRGEKAASASIDVHHSGNQIEDLWGSLLRRISIYEMDGEDFVWERAQKAESRYDLVFVDAYDGEDVVPRQFLDRNGQFLSSLSSLLTADHGTVVVNLHTDSAPPNMVERLSGKFGPGYDPSLPQGKRVLETAAAYRDVLLRGGDSWRFQDYLSEGRAFSSQGLAFTVSVSLQGNISLVVSRGALKGLQDTVGLAGGKSGHRYLVDALVHQARNLQTSVSVPFDMMKRVSRGFRSL
ncbi:hypothetical protein R1flu_019900 [Riccia fluitans]|uniref:S-adenosyl-L-methionine-dependent methyltransferase superfamily protein n=1 Tax=Riccia fluitans TaxID=41844 RepID=A0ABD1ZL19_9MARC